MKKRQFLNAAVASLAGAAAVSPLTAQAASKGLAGPALLTLTGAISKPNRGHFDPEWDQMMHKQKISFDKAYAFDFAALTALPAVTINPQLELDSKPHALRGPLLLDVVRAAGGAVSDNGKLVLRALDGYAATLTMAQARSRRWIVATHLDGATMGLGGLGPLWALFDPGKVAELAGLPLAERFGGCPWGLYHIEVQA